MANSNRTVTLGLVQMGCGTEPEENLQKAIDGIGEAARKGAHIVCRSVRRRSQFWRK